MKHLLPLLAMFVGVGLILFAVIALSSDGLAQLLASKYASSTRDTQAPLLGAAFGAALIFWGIGRFERAPNEHEGPA